MQHPREWQPDDTKGPAAAKGMVVILLLLVVVAVILAIF
jgi:hypothetical protein